VPGKKRLSFTAKHVGVFAAWRPERSEMTTHRLDPPLAHKDDISRKNNPRFDQFIFLHLVFCPNLTVRPTGHPPGRLRPHRLGRHLTCESPLLLLRLLPLPLLLQCLCPPLPHHRRTASRSSVPQAEQTRCPGVAVDREREVRSQTRKERRNARTDRYLLRLLLEDERNEVRFFANSLQNRVLQGGRGRVLRWRGTRVQ